MSRIMPLYGTGSITAKHDHREKNASNLESYETFQMWTLKVLALEHLLHHGSSLLCKSQQNEHALSSHGAPACLPRVQT